MLCIVTLFRLDWFRQNSLTPLSPPLSLPRPPPPPPPPTPPRLFLFSDLVSSLFSSLILFFLFFFPSSFFFFFLLLLLHRLLLFLLLLLLLVLYVYETTPRNRGWLCRWNGGIKQLDLQTVLRPLLLRAVYHIITSWWQRWDSSTPLARK